MCLRIVSKHKPKPSGIGYKIYKNTGTKSLRLRGAYNEVTYKLGETYEARRLPPSKIENMAWDGMKYEPGFHVYRSLKEARQDLNFRMDIIVKVKYDRAHTIGKGMDDESVVVVGKIQLIEVVDQYHSFSLSA